MSMTNSTVVDAFVSLLLSLHFWNPNNVVIHYFMCWLTWSVLEFSESRLSISQLKDFAKIQV